MIITGDYNRKILCSEIVRMYNDGMTERTSGNKIKRIWHLVGLINKSNGNMYYRGLREKKDNEPPSISCFNDTTTFPLSICETLLFTRNVNLGQCRFLS